MPLAYFVNGYQRHHEKLSGMAGDWMDNRLHACEPNALHELPPPCGSECTQDATGG